MPLNPIRERVLRMLFETVLFTENEIKRQRSILNRTALMLEGVLDSPALKPKKRKEVEAVQKITFDCMKLLDLANETKSEKDIKTLSEKIEEVYDKILKVFGIKDEESR